MARKKSAQSRKNRNKKPAGAGSNNGQAGTTGADIQAHAHSKTGGTTTTGPIPNLFWGYVSMDDLRSCSRFVGLPERPPPHQPLPCLAASRYLRQDSPCWRQLHTGALTTGILKEALGLREPLAARVVGGRNESSHAPLLAAFQHLRQPHQLPLPEQTDSRQEAVWRRQVLAGMLLPQRQHQQGGEQEEEGRKDREGDERRRQQLRDVVEAEGHLDLQERYRRCAAALREGGLQGVRCGWGRVQEAAALAQLLQIFPDSSLHEVGLCCVPPLASSALSPSSGPPLLPPLAASPDALIAHHLVLQPEEARLLLQAAEGLAAAELNASHSGAQQQQQQQHVAAAAAVMKQLLRELLDRVAMSLGTSSGGDDDDGDDDGGATSGVASAGTDDDDGDDGDDEEDCADEGDGSRSNGGTWGCGAAAAAAGPDDGTQGDGVGGGLRYNKGGGWEGYGGDDSISSAWGGCGVISPAGAVAAAATTPTFRSVTAAAPAAATSTAIAAASSTSTKIAADTSFAVAAGSTAAAATAAAVALHGDILAAVLESRLPVVLLCKACGGGAGSSGGVAGEKHLPTAEAAAAVLPLLSSSSSSLSSSGGALVPPLSSRQRDDDDDDKGICGADNGDGKVFPASQGQRSGAVAAVGAGPAATAAAAVADLPKEEDVDAIVWNPETPVAVWCACGGVGSAVAATKRYSRPADTAVASATCGASGSTAGGSEASDAHHSAVHVVLREVVEVKSTCPFGVRQVRRGGKGRLVSEWVLSDRGPRSAVSPLWVPQLQLHMVATGCQSGLLVSRSATKGTTVFRMMRDDDYLHRMLCILERFTSEYVRRGVPPPRDMFARQPDYAGFLSATARLARTAVQITAGGPWRPPAEAQPTQAPPLAQPSGTEGTGLAGRWPYGASNGGGNDLGARRVRTGPLDRDEAFLIIRG